MDVHPCFTTFHSEKGVRKFSRKVAAISNFYMPELEM